MAHVFFFLSFSFSQGSQSCTLPVVQCLKQTYHTFCFYVWFFMEGGQVACSHPFVGRSVLAGWAVSTGSSCWASLMSQSPAHCAIKGPPAPGTAVRSSRKGHPARACVEGAVPQCGSSFIQVGKSCAQGCLRGAWEATLYYHVFVQKRKPVGVEWGSDGSWLTNDSVCVGSPGCGS